MPVIKNDIFIDTLLKELKLNRDLVNDLLKKIDDLQQKVVILSDYIYNLNN